MIEEDHPRPAPRVSVVVPVYDPGPHIQPCISSILGQTLPAGQVEAIFIDDGSTDETPARLDRLAVEYPDIVRVIHIPPSGSPGRPRNVGLEAARGEFVQFLDADDELAVDALERLVAMADRNRSDIVVGKFASASIPRSQRLFDVSVDRCTLADTPRLVDSSLGPTKLFRRDFLVTHGIAFPEGWRRMEDQHFTLHAYLRARVISILADHPCYFFHRRDDGTHLSVAKIDPERHFAHLRSIIDLVEAETAPGPLRDRILRRLIRIEVLARVGELTYPDLPEDDRAQLFSAASDLLRDRIGASVLAGLEPVARVRCQMLRDDRRAGLLTLAEHMRDLDLSTTLELARWRGGVLEVNAAATLVFGTAGRPLVVVRRGRRSFMDPVFGDETLGRSIDVTEDVAGLRIDLILRERQSALEWHVKAHADLFSRIIEDGARGAGPTWDGEAIPLGAASRASIDLMRVGAGATPIGMGTWDLLIRLSVLGIARTVPLGSTHTAGVEAICRPALLGDPARVVVPVIDATGLRLEVDPSAPVLANALAGRPVRVARDGDRLTLELAMLAGPSAAPLATELVVRTPAGDRVLAGVLRASFGIVMLDAQVAGLAGLGPGPHPMLLRLGGSDSHAEVALGAVRIEGPSRLRVEGLASLTGADRAVALTHWPIVRLGAALRSFGGRAERASLRRARAVDRRLPGRLGGWVRTFTRRIR